MNINNANAYSISIKDGKRRKNHEINLIDCWSWPCSNEVKFAITIDARSVFLTLSVNEANELMEKINKSIEYIKQKDLINE
jgi:hypothetical protein